MSNSISALIRGLIAGPRFLLALIQGFVVPWIIALSIFAIACGAIAILVALTQFLFALPLLFPFLMPVFAVFLSCRRNKAARPTP